MEGNLIIIECDYCMQDLHLLDARMHETKTNELVLLHPHCAIRMMIRDKVIRSIDFQGV